MQLQGLMLMIFLLIAIPVILLSTNHLIFFLVMTLILMVSAVRNIYKYVFSTVDNGQEPDDELVEELEDLVDLNMKKFGTGIHVVKSLFIMLFLVYCAFYLNSLPLKTITAAALVLQVKSLITVIKDENSNAAGSKKVSGFPVFLSSVLILTVIVFAACNILVGTYF